MTDKEYAEFKAICKSKGISYDTKAEYKEAARNLVECVRLSYDIAQEHYYWEQRLKKEPTGFAIESKGRSCCLCHASVMGEVWYDFMSDTFLKLTGATSKFVNGEFTDKKEILLAIGQNPILLDGELSITPDEWLIPVKKNAKHFN